MLMLQIVQVHQLFDQIEKLKNSQWQEVCPVSINPKSSSSSTSRRTKKSKIPRASHGILDPNQPKKANEYSINFQNQPEFKIETKENLQHDSTEELVRKLSDEPKVEIMRPHSRTFKNVEECLNRCKSEKSFRRKFTPNLVDLKFPMPNIYDTELPNNQIQNNILVVGHCTPYPMKSNVSELYINNFEKPELSYTESKESFPDMKSELNFENDDTQEFKNMKNQQKRSRSPDGKGQKLTRDVPNKDKSRFSSTKDQTGNYPSYKETYSKRSGSHSPQVKPPGKTVLERQKEFANSLRKKKFLNSEEIKKSNYKQNACGKTSLRSRSLDSRQKSKHSVSFANDANLDTKAASEKHISRKTWVTEYVSAEDFEPTHFSFFNKTVPCIKSKNLKRTQSMLRMENDDSANTNLTGKIHKTFENKNSNFTTNLQAHIPVNNLTISKEMASRVSMRDRIINHLKISINKFRPKGGCVEKPKIRRNFPKPGLKKWEPPTNINLMDSQTFLNMTEIEDFQSRKQEDKCSSSKFDNVQDLKKPRISKLRPPSSSGRKYKVSDRDDSETGSKRTVKTNKYEENEIEISNQDSQSLVIDEINSKSLEREPIVENLDGRGDNTNRQIKCSGSKPEKPTIIRRSKIRSLSPKRNMDSSRNLNSNESVIIRKSLKSIKTNSLDDEVESHQNTITNSMANKLPNKDRRIKTVQENKINASKARAESWNRKKEKSTEKKETTIANDKNEQSSKNSINKKKFSVVSNVWCNLNSCDDDSFHDKTKPEEKTKKIESLKNLEKENHIKVKENNSRRSMVSSKSASQTKMSKNTSKNVLKRSKETHLNRKSMKQLSHSNASKFDKMKKYDTKRKTELVINSIKGPHNSKLISDNVVSGRHKIEEDKSPNYVECFKSLLNVKVAEKSIVDLQMRNLLEKNKNFHHLVSNVSNRFPWQNSEIQEIKLKQRSRSPATISLASFCGSETSLTRVMIETSRIIQSKSKVMGIFNPNAYSRASDESSLTGYHRYVPVKREKAELKIHDEENHGLFEFTSKVMRSFTGSSENETPKINIRHACNFLKSNRTLCRLSLYLYVYGMLSLILILLKINSCKFCFLDNKIFYKMN